jgi:hypothetical protein
MQGCRPSPRDPSLSSRLLETRFSKVSARLGLAISKPRLGSSRLRKAIESRDLNKIFLNCVMCERAYVHFRLCANCECRKRLVLYMYKSV